MVGDQPYGLKIEYCKLQILNWGFVGGSAERSSGQNRVESAAGVIVFTDCTD
jgi:hypothetical protein